MIERLLIYIWNVACVLQEYAVRLLVWILNILEGLVMQTIRVMGAKVFAVIFVSSLAFTVVTLFLFFHEGWTFRKVVYAGGGLIVGELHGRGVI